MKLFSFFKKNRKKPKQKYKLNVIQTESQFIVKGIFNLENYFAQELWVFSRDTNIGYKVGKIKPANEFVFNVSLDTLFDILESNYGNVYDWYFKILRPYSSLSEAKKESDNIKLVEKNGEKYTEYFIRVGRFQDTKIEGLSFYYQKDNYLINYLTTKGNLSLVINSQPGSPTKVQIEKVKKNKDTLKIQGKLITRKSILNNVKVVLKGRETTP